MLADNTPADLCVAYLGLGSNIGYRIQYLSDAVGLLNKTSGISMRETSAIYETTSVSAEKQNKYLNCCAVIETSLSAQELLHQIHNVESTLLRGGAARPGARIIDIDILLYEEEQIKSPSLTIPHERMFERAFMLIPLLELYKGNAMTLAKMKTALLLCDCTSVVKYANDLLES